MEIKLLLTFTKLHVLDNMFILLIAYLITKFKIYREKTLK